MRIGIDIDDVITNTYQSIKSCMEECDKNNELSNYMEEIMRGDNSNPIVKRFFDENCSEYFINVKMKDNANEVIKKLLENGHEVYIISARGEIRFKGSEEITLNYFKANNIPFTKILWNSFDKATLCKDNNIDVMVDDSAKHCIAVQNQNIKSILFTSEVNKSIEVNIPRVNNWLELEHMLNNLA